MRTPDWVTANREYIPLSSMTSGHILGALKYVIEGDGEYGPMTRNGCSGFTNAEWILLFRTELLRRSRAGML